MCIRDRGWGAPDATTIGVAAGTMGNIMGSLIGGPVAAFLIAKHGLKSDPNDKPEAAATGKVPELNLSLIHISTTRAQI